MDNEWNLNFFGLGKYWIFSWDDGCMWRDGRISCVVK